MADADNKQPNTHWTPADEEALVTVLEKAREDGLQADSGWKPLVWQRAVEAVLLVHTGGAPKNIPACKNRWQRFKKDYADVRRLRDLSGFGWDETRQMVMASSDVWEGMRTANNKLYSWRKKSFLHYDRLSILIDGVIATGQGAFRAGARNYDTNNSSSSSSNIELLDDEILPDRLLDATPVKPGLPFAPPFTSTPFAASPMTPCVFPAPGMQPVKQETPVGDFPLRKKKGRGRESGADSLFSLGATLEGVADALTGGTESQVRLSSPQRRKAAIAAVEEDEGLSDSELVDTAEMFRNDTSIADTYMALKKPSAKTKYLQTLLEKSL